jgi:hypothetical protein
MPWSRSRTKRRWLPSNVRRRESMAASCPLPGLVNRRRSQIGVAADGSSTSRRERGRDGAVSVQLGGLLAALGVRCEEGVVGHQKVDLDGHVGRSALPGEPFDQDVGHDLAPAAGVALADLRVRRSAERGICGDALRDGKQCREPGHRVRCRPQADAPVLLGAADTGEVAGGIESVGQRLALGLHAAVPPRLQRGRELAIDGSAVGSGQPRGFPSHDHRARLGNPARP